MILSSMTLCAALMSSPAILPPNTTPTRLTLFRRGPSVTTGTTGTSGTTSTGMTFAERGFYDGKHDDRATQRCYNVVGRDYTENVSSCREELTFQLLDCGSNRDPFRANRCAARAYAQYTLCNLRAQRRLQRASEHCQEGPVFNRD